MTWRRQNNDIPGCGSRWERRHRLSTGVVLFAFICLLIPSVSAQTDANLSRQLSGDSEQKRSALFEIRNLRTEQASRLAVPALTDADAIVRATAASSIVFLPADEAVRVLVPLLNDTDEFPRREAAYALGTVASPDAAAPLLRRLSDEKVFEVKTAIVAALGKCGNPVAVEPLTRILKKTPNEADEFLRRSAARSIGQIAQIGRTGRTQVLTPQNFLPEKYKDLENSANAGPDIRSAVPVLIKVLQNKKESGDARREAAFALGAIGDSSSIAVLEANRNSADPYLAEICKEALLKIERSGR